MKLRITARRSHGTVVAYVALFLALGGTTYAAATIGSADIRDDAVLGRHVAAGAIGSAELRSGAVNSGKILNGSLTGVDIKDGSLQLADLPATVTTLTVNTPNLVAGACAFASSPANGVTQDEGLLAYTTSDWDNRLMITGIESGQGVVVLQVCNHTTNTNIGAGSADIVVWRF